MSFNSCAIKLRGWSTAISSSSAHLRPSLPLMPPLPTLDRRTSSSRRISHRTLLLDDIFNIDAIFVNDAPTHADHAVPEDVPLLNFDAMPFPASSSLDFHGTELASH